MVATSNGLPVKIYALNADGTIGDFVESKAVFGKRGAYVAAGDVNGDGRDELVVGAGTGKPGLVRIFSDTDLDGKVLDNQTDSFTAFSSGFRGGVTVAAGNTTNIGGAEVVMGMASKGQQVRIRTDADADLRVSDEPVHETFTNYPSSFKLGVNVAAGPIENAGGNGDEVITAPVAGKRKVVDPHRHERERQGSRTKPRSSSSTRSARSGPRASASQPATPTTAASSWRS